MKIKIKDLDKIYDDSLQVAFYILGCLCILSFPVSLLYFFIFWQLPAAPIIGTLMLIAVVAAYGLLEIDKSERHKEPT